MNSVPKPPVGLRTGGRRLWVAVMAEFELDEHETCLLLEACRTVDLLDVLATAVEADGALVDSAQGQRVHPAVVESRQQSICLARLIAALRLPSGDESDARPQRRVAARGVYALGLA